MTYRHFVVVVQGKGTVHHFDVWAVDMAAAEADVREACYEPEIIQIYSR